MHESIDLYRFLFGSKISLCALVLPERVKLANEKLAARDERMRRFIEDGIKIFDMLEHQVANDELERSGADGPGFRQISPNKKHVIGSYFHHRLSQHSRRKIQRQDFATDTIEKCSVLTGSTSQLEDVLIITIAERTLRRNFIEVACTVPIGIVSRRPARVCVLNFHRYNGISNIT